MHRVVKTPTGTVRVLVFATDDPALIERDTQAVLAEIPGSEYVGENVALPSSRRFRNCWTHTGGPAVDVDMPKARVQRLDEIRAERNAKLDASDKEILRAQEQGKASEVTVLQAKRQALRDLPTTVAPQLDAISDPDALAAFEPAWPA